MASRNRAARQHDDPSTEEEPAADVVAGSDEGGDAEPAPVRPSRKRARKTKPPVAGAAAPEPVDGADFDSQRAGEDAPAGPPVRTRRRGRRADSNKLALPVIISDETILLPHMSIPFPIEDDETSKAVDRAMRMNPRLVLMLTERRVRRDAGD
nr:hypothetical protein [Chloroflexia bacterium]